VQVAYDGDAYLAIHVSYSSLKMDAALLVG
jgi:hypothetical protein